MLVVGLTGGIGSGKSTVARLLERRGAVVIDADRIAREVVEPGRPAHRAIVEEFGEGILGPDGAIDRPRLAEVVFADHAKRRRLNAIVHPEVGREMQALLQRVREAEASGADPAVVVMDVPLLVEGGGASSVDLLVVVAASERTQVERLVAERGMTEEQVRARMRAQAPLEDKATVADWLITNGGSLADLEGQVDALWKVLDAKRRGEEPPRGSPPPVL